MLEIINIIFAAAWYVIGFSFLIQLIKIIKIKQVASLSIWSYTLFCLLSISSMVWLYSSDPNWQWSLPGALLIFVTCFGIVYFIYKYDPAWRPKYKAFIFDLDGTIFDTQTPLHAWAEAKVLERHGIIVDPNEISKKYAGHSTHRVFKELAPDCNPDQMVSEKWEMIREWLKDGHPKPLDDIINLIFDLKKRKIPIIIASASPRWYIEEMLKKSVWERNSSEIRLNYIRYPLKNYFGDNYVSAEEVLNPKPDPDVFLAAAERLGVDPKKCLVIGDGRSDVYGGVSAGMNVLFLGQEDEEIKNLSAVKAFDTDSLLYNYVKQVHFNKTF